MRQLAVLYLAVLAAASGVQGSIFSVGHGAGISRNGKIKFENVLNDSDGSWKFRRSRFVCSDPGYYFITFHGLSRRNSPLTLQLMHNKMEVVRAYGDGNGYHTASNSAIVYLQFGDKISLRVAEGVFHESNNLLWNYVTLSGFKIGDSQPIFGGGGTGFAATAPGTAPGTGTEVDLEEEEEQEEEFIPVATEEGGPGK